MELVSSTFEIMAMRKSNRLVFTINTAFQVGFANNLVVGTLSGKN